MKTIILSPGGREQAFINTPDGSFMIKGDLVNLYIERNFKRYFGLLVFHRYHLHKMMTHIHSRDIYIKHRNQGRYYEIYLKIFKMWKLVKTVRRLPKCWLPELNADSNLIEIAKDALRDKGLDHCIGLPPIDQRKQTHKIRFRARKRQPGRLVPDGNNLGETSNDL